MTMRYPFQIMRVVPIVFVLAACGSGDKAADAAKDGAAVEAAADASVADMPADASTADAMSVDVAAGGVEPMTDPAVAVQSAEPAAPAETVPAQ